VVRVSDEGEPAGFELTWVRLPGQRRGQPDQAEQDRAGDGADRGAWDALRGKGERYELRSADVVEARLWYQRRSGAQGCAGEGRWRFSRAGFWHPRVIIEAAGSRREIARFTTRWLGTGSLEMPDGARFHWGPSNFWQSQWAWQDGAGAPLLRFGRGGGHTWGPGKAAGSVTVDEASRTLPELPLLLLLGWYLELLRAQDTLDTTAAVTVVTG